MLLCIIVTELRHLFVAGLELFLGAGEGMLDRFINVLQRDVPGNSSIHTRKSSDYKTRSFAKKLLSFALIRSRLPEALSILP